MPLASGRRSLDMRAQMIDIAALSLLSQAAAATASVGLGVLPSTIPADSPSALKTMRISSLKLCQLSEVSSSTVWARERRENRLGCVKHPNDVVMIKKKLRSGQKKMSKGGGKVEVMTWRLVRVF
ncbi:hypothetical protein B0H11DRAFT_2067798 [Mycena galericulata]|nr:hypothetical protein B0H11DRAFT_2067798 [Mycena galericulata]